MIMFSATAALAATLIAGPAASADPRPPAALSGDIAGATADNPGAEAPAPRLDKGLDKGPDSGLDTVVSDPGYGPSGPDDSTEDSPGFTTTGYSPAYAPVAKPAVMPAVMPAVAPASLTGQAAPQAAQPKQAVYHLKGKDGVRHDVVVVPISDDPSKPITLPDFGFQKFKVTDKPRTHRPRAHKHHHRGKAHPHR
ncbi:hypothetical protein F5972_13745 [Microbispora cellulosiformans]|uniref:Uncharacterized protein n=1 Tax=Microbispora cellulosiformans TaxID=2614688 RepID=A0A5J5K483_9ACTN|nr:hypothetical protein [Microbispora cellulosiformans]KAA9379233.1 hypothetical protein F5972_13745 [Microbispora cellulosiformans]